MRFVLCSTYILYSSVLLCAYVVNKVLRLYSTNSLPIDLAQLLIFLTSMMLLIEETRIRILPRL